MGINLHEETEPSREVETSEVTQMRSKMKLHSEETNEVFNLMARQIKKRCQERINLYTVENVDKKLPTNLLTENEMDHLILSNETEENTENDYNDTPSPKTVFKARQSTSRGNSPPKEDAETTMMQTMLTQR